MSRNAFLGLEHIRAVVASHISAVRTAAMGGSRDLGPWWARVDSIRQQVKIDQFQWAEPGRRSCKYPRPRRKLHVGCGSRAQKTARNRTREQINKIAIHISNIPANLAIGKITAGGQVHEGRT